MSKVVELKSRRKKKLSSADTQASLRVNEDIRNRIKGHAVNQGVPVYELVNKILSDWLQARPRVRF